MKIDKSPRDPSLDLITSDMNLARVFTGLARSAYGHGKLEEAEFARLSAIKFYCEALQSILKLTESEREPYSSDLQNLRTNIEWLSLQTGRPRNSPPETKDEACMDTLLKLLEGKS